MALVAGLIVGVMLAGLVGWLGFRAYEAHNLDTQRNLFVQAASQGAANLLTVDYQHADADAQRILNSATGKFYDSFSRRKQSYIDNAKRTRSQLVGTVTDAGLEIAKRRPGPGSGGGDGEVVGSRADTPGAAFLADTGHGAEDGRRRQGLRRGVRAMTQPQGVNWSRVLVYGLLPALALLLAIAAGLLKWKDSSARNTDLARSESVAAARDSTVAAAFVPVRHRGPGRGGRAAAIDRQFPRHLHAADAGGTHSECERTTRRRDGPRSRGGVGVGHPQSRGGPGIRQPNRSGSVTRRRPRPSPASG